MDTQETTRKLTVTRQLDYRLLLPPLYQGAASTVYKAMDLDLNRTVIVKAVPLAGLSAEDRRALRSEVNSCCQCGGWTDHIPQIYHRFEQNGNLYLVMQYIPGHTLREELKAQHLGYRDKMDLAIQLCQILAPLHRHKFQHRDLRPENLQVVTHGWTRQLWLLDFNISAAVPRLNRGTMGYLAPEQTGLSRQAGAGRVDVFAIGVILYEMFAGFMPLYGQEYYNDPNGSAWALFTPPSAHDPQLPQGLDRIVEKCMRMNWKERYENAGQIAEELLRLRRTGSKNSPKGGKDRHP